MLNKRLFYFISPFTLLLVWEVLSQSAFIDPRFFPPPSAIIHHLLFVSPDEGLFNDILASLWRILWGYSIGCILGIAIGTAMGMNKNIRTILFPLVAISYPIPKIAILPLIMLIFGLGELSKIVVVIIGSFFLVLMNTLQGVDSISKVIHDVAHVYRFSKYDTVKNVILPGALPSIFTGLKLAIGYSLVIVVAAEFSGANAGLGYLIWQSWETFSIKSMYAGIFVIAALGFTFAVLLDYAQKKIIPWYNN